MTWKHNTYEAVELALISVEAAKDALEGAYEALAEAKRIEAADNATADLSDEDALEALNDEGIPYDLGEAIIAHRWSLVDSSYANPPKVIVTHFEDHWH